MPVAAMDSEWFRSYYGDDYAASVRDVLDTERTRREVAFILAATGVGRDAPVADLGCGEGRHALAFARLGHPVTALDLNPSFLARGADQARREGLSVRWLCADMRTPQHGPYGLVLLLFHSFGFFSDSENLQLLRDWRQQIVPYGRMVIDVWNRDRILGDFEPHAERSVAAGLAIAEDRDWDAATDRLRVHYTYRRRDGCVHSYDTSFRLYAKQELEALLATAGLPLRATFGSLLGEGWRPDAPRLVVVAG